MHTRHRRLAALILLGSITLGSLSACSGSEGEPSTSPSANPSSQSIPKASGPSESVQTVTPDEKTGDYNVCAQDQRPFTGDAAVTFGAAKVMDAYCWLVDRELGTDGHDSTLIRQESGFTADQFTAWTDRMTSTMRTKWNAAVAKAVAGDSEAAKTLWALTYYGVLKGSDYQFTDLPPVRTKAYHKATATVEKGGTYGTDQLVLTFRLDTTFTVAKRSDPSTVLLLPVAKVVRFHLTPTGDKTEPWFIDDVQADYRMDSPTAP